MARLDRVVAPTPEEQGELLRQHERTGRPLGGERFLAYLELALSRGLRSQKRGQKGLWKHGRTD